MVLVGVLIAGGLGGCASDGGSSEGASESSPPPSPTPEATASPAPKHVVVAPERPAALADDGPAGAKAAAVYFLQLDAHMQATGETTEWEAMSHSTCDYCKDRLEQAREIQAGEYVWAGGEIDVDIRHIYTQDAATGIWPLDAMLTQSAATVTADGDVISEISRASALRRLEVARENGRWVFVEAGNIPR